MPSRRHGTVATATCWPGAWNRRRAARPGTRGCYVSSYCITMMRAGRPRPPASSTKLSTAMTGFDRAAHCRRIASRGGKTTAAKYGAAYISAIGKRGFAKAVELGWGLELAAKLGPAYLRKYGKPLKLGQGTREDAAIRAEARRLYSGSLCDACAERVGQVHHIHGLRSPDPNEPSNIRNLCPPCHRAEHRR